LAVSANGQYIYNGYQAGIIGYSTNSGQSFSSKTIYKNGPTTGCSVYTYCDTTGRYVMCIIANGSQGTVLYSSDYASTFYTADNNANYSDIPCGTITSDSSNVYAMANQGSYMMYGTVPLGSSTWTWTKVNISSSGGGICLSADISKGYYINGTSVVKLSIS
jgi:hypothetical protein